MPTTLTLKNIPDAVYDRLKLAAEMHRRSLNSEAIVCLESVLLPTKMMPSERIARARGFLGLAVISAVGTRDYYAARGFRQGELYMRKPL